MTQKRGFPRRFSDGFPTVLPAVSRRFCPGFSSGSTPVFQRFCRGFSSGSTGVFQRFDAGFPAVRRRGFPAVSRFSSGFRAVFQRFPGGFPAVSGRFSSGSTTVFQRFDNGFPAVHQRFTSGLPEVFQLADIHGLFPPRANVTTTSTRDYMGWTSCMGWTVDALWAAARVSLGSPISGPRGRSRFRGRAFHRRCCLPVLNLRRNALSGLQNGRRGPSRRFSVERGGPGLPKTR